jgi:outer membrane protein assembly factor BamB
VIPVQEANFTVIFKRTPLIVTLFALILSARGSFGQEGGTKIDGWLSWRGPHQNGSSDEKNLPEKWTPGGENSLWTADIPGQSTPVIANGRLYVMGYIGAGPDLQEGLFCLDAVTGEEKWRRMFNDYLSDIIYTRYASSSPSVDPETGNIFMQGTQGILAAFSPDGKMLWSHHMMEEFGRMTFPNGRTASPVIDGELVIASGITSNWGAHGPAMHRFYGFDKKTGDLIWASQPGVRPRDSSYSTPVLGWYKTQRVFWSGGGDGSVYCVNARTGDPLWRRQICQGGINGTVLNYKDLVIAVHGNENVSNAITGSMVAIRAGEFKSPPQDPNKAPVTPELPATSEAWRDDDMLSFASSPALGDNKIFLVDDVANLHCIDAETGKQLWKEPKKLGGEQRTSAPTYGDGKLYVPIQDAMFFILKIKPDGTGCEELTAAKLGYEESCYGAPSIYGGRVYFQTTRHLYCIGSANAPVPAAAAPELVPAIAPGAPAKFMVVPADMLLSPKEKQPFRLIAVDHDGNWLGSKDGAAAKWEHYIPPYALVKSSLDGEIEGGALVVGEKTTPSAGAFKAEVDGVTGTTRGRVLPALPLTENFEEFQLIKTDDPKFPETHAKVPFAYPPLPWIGARFKWEIREVGGNKCLVKTIEDGLFQRAFTFVGHPDMSNYTVQADVMSDGKFRTVAGQKRLSSMSDVGLINQRYMIVLLGTSQRLLITSNAELFQKTVPFKWNPDVWYTMKTEVKIDPATKHGTIRGKVWPKGTPEPAEWTITATQKTPNESGTPGIFGFSPKVPVYVDNLSVTANDK